MRRARLLLVVALGALGCSDAKDSGRRFVVGFSQSTLEDPWRVAMVEAAKAEAAHHPRIELRVADGGNDNQKQASDVDNFAVQGVDLLIISPREAEPLTPAVERIHRKGTPVIVLDREIAGEAYTCFIGASNLEIGREAGKFIAERLSGKGRIVEIEGIPGATPTQERRGGMHEAIAAHPGLEVVLAQPGDYKRGPAQTIMENALQAHPQIDCVYAHNDEMAIGAWQAAQAAGRAQGIVFVGVDGQKEAIRLIVEGKLHATFVYPTCGREAVQVAARILEGQTVERRIRLKTAAITGANAKSVYDPNAPF
jgi:ribose transport system substrate-binding protein